MSEWKTVKLGDVCEIVTGGTPSTTKKEYWENGTIPWLQSGVCQNCFVNNTEIYITQAGLDNSSAKLMPKDTVLIALTGATTGKVGYLTFEACANQSVTGILPSKTFNQLYLYYCLLSKREKILSDSYGGAQKHISQGYVKNLEVQMPSIAEQTEIAKILEKNSKLITEHKLMLEKYDMLIKSRFIEMFGDLANNTKNWVIKNFTECAIIDTKMIKDFEKYADYPHIGIDSIEKETGILSGYRTVKEDNVISGKYLFTPEHIIYSKIRPNLNKVAMPDFYGLCSADAYPILVKKNVTTREYLTYVMRSDFYVSYILAFSRRANMPKVNKEQVESFNLPLPPYELQKHFSSFVQQIDKSKFVVQQSLEKAETLNKSLMQEYFG